LNPPRAYIMLVGSDVCSENVSWHRMDGHLDEGSLLGVWSRPSSGESGLVVSASSTISARTMSPIIISTDSPPAIRQRQSLGNSLCVKQINGHMSDGRFYIWIDGKYFP
jgi:nicotinic acid mononucleotide adenylyltransferase